MGFGSDFVTRDCMTSDIYFCLSETQCPDLSNGNVLSSHLTTEMAMNVEGHL